MACSWSAPEAFGPAMLGAPFIDMQPPPTAGGLYSLYEVAGGETRLTAAMSAIGGGTPPADALADLLHDLGDDTSLIPGALPSGPNTQAVGPIFAPGAFDESTTGRAAQKTALAAAVSPGTAKVAMGCIDTSIAFVNARFRKIDPGGGPDRTRFEMLWVQGRALKSPGPYSTILRAGTLLLRADIDALIAKHWSNSALNEAGVYGEFTKPPEGEADLWSMRTGHGTTVLDLMAGVERDAANDDVALYGIELPVSVVSDTSGAVFHGPLTYGLAVLGVGSYVLSQLSGGGAAPLVTNVSMGFLGGPQDGSHATASALAAVAAASEGPAGGQRMVEVTLPSGNHLQDRVHARAIPQSATEMLWSLPPEDRTASFIEIWGEAPGTPPDVTEVTLCPPGETGGVTASLPASGERIHLEANGQRLAQLHNLGTHLLVGVYPTSNWTTGQIEAPSGLWRLTAKGSGTVPLLFWVARDNTLVGLKSAGRQSWIRDSAYQARDGYGNYLVESAMAPEGLRRDGTLSVLATASGAPITVVPGREARGTKPYSFAGLAVGQATPPAPGPFAPAAEVARPLGGPIAATRKGRGAARVAGSSMASAIQARNIAEGIMGVPASDPLGYREPSAYRY